MTGKREQRMLEGVGEWPERGRGGGGDPSIFPFKPLAGGAAAALQRKRGGGASATIGQQRHQTLHREQREESVVSRAGAAEGRLVAVAAALAATATTLPAAEPPTQAPSGPRSNRPPQEANLILSVADGSKYWGQTQ